MSEIFPMKKRYNFAKKFEETFSFIAFPLLLLVLWGLLQIYENYQSTLNNISSFRLSKMKVTYINGKGYKGGRSVALGYVIGEKAKCFDCVTVTISVTSVWVSPDERNYYDVKYGSTAVGDTIPVWYSNTLNRAKLVFPKNKNGLIEFETREMRDQLEIALKMLSIPFGIYFIARQLRKYYQKKMSHY